MPDPSHPDLGPVADFVAYESEVRFPVAKVPTELLGWLPPHERIGKETHEDEAEDISDPRERMIQSTWAQYDGILKREGYGVLTDLEEKLQTRHESEVRRKRVQRHRLNSLKGILTSFEDLIDGNSEEGLLREVIDSPAEFDSKLPHVYEVKWSGSEGSLSGRNAKEEACRGVIAAVVKVFDVPEFDPPHVEFSVSDTLGDVAQEVERKLNRDEKDIDSAQKLQELIRFRLKLLQRFLWMYEVSGTVQKPTVQKIPQLVQRSPKRLAHMVRVLKLIEPLHEDGQPRDGEWPSQPDLKEEAEDRFEDASFGAAPASVVTQVADLLRELFSLRYGEFGDDFYVLLLEHEETIREWADEMDVEV